jgi:hypothetical protein
MLRVLRIAAVLGMLMSTVAFVWFQLDVLLNHDRPAVHGAELLHRMVWPSIWFGEAAILYVLIDLVRAKGTDGVLPSEDSRPVAMGGIRGTMARHDQGLGTKG